VVNTLACKTSTREFESHS